MEDSYYNFDHVGQQRKKVRSSSTSSTDSMDVETQQEQRPGDLELDTVKELFQRYDLAEGDNIPCCICGKYFTYFYALISTWEFIFEFFCVLASTHGLAGVDDNNKGLILIALKISPTHICEICIYLTCDSRMFKS